MTEFSKKIGITNLERIRYANHDCYRAGHEYKNRLEPLFISCFA